MIDVLETSPDLNIDPEMEEKIKQTARAMLGIKVPSPVSVAPDIHEANTAAIPAQLREITGVVSGEEAQGRLRTVDYTTDQRLYWQEIQFGGDNIRKAGTFTSAYIGIDAEDLPEMIKILIPVAQRQAAYGPGLSIRWLSGISQVGNYANLLPTDPRLIIDGQDETEIKKLFGEMVKDPKWHEIERKRITQYDSSQVNKLPHLAGTKSDAAPQIVLRRFRA